MVKIRQKIAVVETKDIYKETDCEACLFFVQCPFEKCPLDFGKHYELK